MTRRQTNNGGAIDGNLSSGNFRLSNRISSYSKDRIAFHPRVRVVLIGREAIRHEGQGVKRLMLHLRRSFSVTVNVTVNSRTSCHAICPRALFGITSRPPRVSRGHFLPTYRSGRCTFRLFNHRAIASDQLFRVSVRYRHACLVRPIISFLYHRTFSKDTSQEPTKLQSFCLRARYHFKVFSSVRLYRCKTVPINVRLTLFRMRQRLCVYLIRGRFLYLRGCCVRDG